VNLFRFTVSAEKRTVLWEWLDLPRKGKLTLFLGAITNALIGGLILLGAYSLLYIVR